MANTRQARANSGNRIALGILIIIVSFFCFLSDVGALGGVGRMVYSFLAGFFGLASYAYSIMGIILGIAVTFNIRPKATLMRTLTYFGLLILAIYALQIYTSSAHIVGAKYGSYLVACYVNTNTAGGMLFGIAAYPLMKLITSVGALVVACAAFFALGVFALIPTLRRNVTYTAATSEQRGGKTERTRKWGARKRSYDEGTAIDAPSAPVITDLSRPVNDRLYVVDVGGRKNRRGRLGGKLGADGYRPLDSFDPLFPNRNGGYEDEQRGAYVAPGATRAQQGTLDEIYAAQAGQYASHEQDRQAIPGYAAHEKTDLARSILFGDRPDSETIDRFGKLNGDSKIEPFAAPVNLAKKNEMAGKLGMNDDSSRLRQDYVSRYRAENTAENSPTVDAAIRAVDGDGDAYTPEYLEYLKQREKDRLIGLDTPEFTGARTKAEAAGYGRDRQVPAPQRTVNRGGADMGAQGSEKDVNVGMLGAVNKGARPDDRCGASYGARTPIYNSVTYTSVPGTPKIPNAFAANSVDRYAQNGGSNGATQGGYVQPVSGAAQGGYVQPVNGATQGGYVQPANGAVQGGRQGYGQRPAYPGNSQTARTGGTYGANGNNNANMGGQIPPQPASGVQNGARQGGATQPRQSTARPINAAGNAANGNVNNGADAQRSATRESSSGGAVRRDDRAQASGAAESSARRGEQKIGGATAGRSEGYTMAPVMTPHETIRPAQVEGGEAPTQPLPVQQPVTGSDMSRSALQQATDIAGTSARDKERNEINARIEGIKMDGAKNTPKVKEFGRDVSLREEKLNAAKQKGDLNPRPERKVKERQVTIEEAISAAEEKPPKRPYVAPPVSLLEPPKPQVEQNEDYEDKKEKIKNALKRFGISGTVSEITVGPTFTRYKLSSVVMPGSRPITYLSTLDSDLAMKMEVDNVRIIAPIPGEDAVGIEVPNKVRRIVNISEIINSQNFNTAKDPVTFALGTNLKCEHRVVEIRKLPHVLIAGATGAGKSCCINSLIVSILYKASPDDVRFILIDPKRVELSIYAGIPHLLMDEIICDTDKAIRALNWAVQEMDRRMKFFGDKHYRDIEDYNSDCVNTKLEKMPRIIVIVDEFADLMSTGKKAVEDTVNRLARLARAAGIHLVLATQRPSVDVISGTIKNNFPSRIAFKVTQSGDSKTVLDTVGAEKLLGYGDLFFMTPGSMMERMQGAFISNNDVRNVVEFIKQHNDCYFDEKVKDAIFKEEEPAQETSKEKGKSKSSELPPELFDALQLGIQLREEDPSNPYISTSNLQRKLGLGFPKAARIKDMIKEMGYLSTDEKNPKKEYINITQEELDELRSANEAQDEDDD